MDDEPNKHLTYTKVCAVYSVQRAHVVCKETCTETDGKCLAMHFYRLKIIIIIKKKNKNAEVSWFYDFCYQYSTS